MSIINLGTVVPDAQGVCSSKYRDGNSGAGTSPSVPELGVASAVSPTSVQIPLLTASTGPSTPITYVLERSLSDISGYSEVASGSVFDTDGLYADTTVAENTQYFYRLKAVGNDSLESGYSAVINITTPAITADTTKPSDVTGVSLSTVGSNSDRLLVDWTPATDNVAVQDYDITLGIGDGAGNPVGTGSVIATVTAPPYTILNLDPSQEYYVRIKARDTSGNLSASGSTRVYCTTPAVSSIPLLFNYGFENGSVNANLINISSNGSGIAEASTTHAREGTYCGRVRVVKSGGTNYRQEFKEKCPAFDDMVMETSDEVWAGFSILIPSSGYYGSLRVVQQWTTESFGSKLSPIIAIVAHNGNFTVSGKVYPTFSGAHPVLTLGAIPFDVWQDFVWRIKFRGESATGLRRLWWNGNLVLTQDNIVTANPYVLPDPKAEPGGTMHRFKFGCYCSTWDTDSTPNGTVAETFVDNLRIVVSNTDCYSLVAPQGNRLLAP